MFDRIESGWVFLSGAALRSSNPGLVFYCSHKYLNVVQSKGKKAWEKKIDLVMHALYGILNL